MYFHSASLKKILFWGAICAFFANLPFYAWIFNKDWPYIKNFPLGWVSTCMNYMGTFFHEIGHTVFMWFYGYPSLPAFDFEHGGGMSWALSDQLLFLLLLIWCGIAYLIFVLKEFIFLIVFLLIILSLNIGLAFNDYHHVVIDYMGPGSEALIASFFLYRAIFDLAPRGDFERFLNSFFGFGLIIQSLINGYGLLKSNAYRLVYYEQKGSHGFGDFDKVADRVLGFSFNGVVISWLILTLVCLVLPFILYMVSKKRAAL